jgi:hypothetical protein
MQDILSAQAEALAGDAPFCNTLIIASPISPQPPWQFARRLHGAASNLPRSAPICPKKLAPAAAKNLLPCGEHENTAYNSVTKKIRP